MILVLLVVVIVLALAGCGDDEQEPTSVPVPADEPATGAEADKAELISRADAICGQAKVAIDMARTRFHHGNFDQASAAELATFVEDRIVPVYRNEISSLRKLPGADTGELAAILDSAEAATVKLAAEPAQINLRGGSQFFDDANGLAEDYGMSVCVAPR